MDTLFRLPQPCQFKPTVDQLALMDLIALHDGMPLPIALSQGERVTLRNLLALELVACTTLGPAAYMLTPVGRLVRERCGRR